MGAGELMLAVLQIVAAFFMSFYYGLESLILSLVPRNFRRKNVCGKVTLITGTGSGIGRLVAQKLAKKGAIIVLWDIIKAGNEETAKIIKKSGGKCYAYTVDLCSKNDIFKTADIVRKQVGKVDILVNNAGVAFYRNFSEASDEEILRTFEVNTLSHFWTTKAFLPAMMAENSGQLVTVASLAGIFGTINLVDYCSSKFAAIGFTESLHMELLVEGYDGVHTTCVCPYFINTGMFSDIPTRIPILDPEFVAGEITDAILMRKEILVLPSSCNFFVAMKGILPAKTATQMFRATTGISFQKRSMEKDLGK